VPLDDRERPRGEEERDERLHPATQFLVVRPVSLERAFVLRAAAPADAGEVVLDRSGAQVLEIRPARPVRRPQDVAEVRVAVDRP
jgi:hypothetical protein